MNRTYPRMVTKPTNKGRDQTPPAQMDSLTAALSPGSLEDLRETMNRRNADRTAMLRNLSRSNLILRYSRTSKRS